MGITDMFANTSALMYVVLFVHLILCITFIAAVPGDRDLHIGGATLSPSLQWANTSFSLVSVFCIVQAVFGSVHMIEGHLNLYFYLLLASVAVDIALLIMFITSGISAAGVVVALLVSIAFKLCCIYVTSKVSKAARNQYNNELLPHLKAALGRSFGSQEDAFTTQPSQSASWPAPAPVAVDSPVAMPARLNATPPGSGMLGPAATPSFSGAQKPWQSVPAPYASTQDLPGPGGQRMMQTMAY
eukprot:TRINITY_DN103896_c0_g1_i1.p1 TRINITY_DN103896_c0_g1~~TRINITY_DN103896_c0_g1_i1.p1  ORF type:complete len:243 (+),score=42.09 TRINITY_DN103896_c0_g1_i1:129-857(+)